MDASKSSKTGENDYLPSNQLLEVDDVPTDNVDVKLLERTRFTPFSAFGFCFCLLNTWVVLTTGLGSALVAGGPSVLFWGFLYAILGNVSLAASLCEPFSVYPTAGGQYHWTAILAPQSSKAALSWFCGMMNMAGYLSGIASNAYLNEILWIAGISILHPDWVPTAGQGYAILLGSLFSALFVTLIMTPRAERGLETGMMYLSMTTCLGIVVTLFVMSKPKADAAFVFTATLNYTGWNSMAIAWLLGLLQSNFSFIGFDLVAHISEEMANPHRDGPRVMLGTIAIGGVSGIILILGILFSISDIDSVIETDFDLPFAQVFYNATNSLNGTAAVIFIVAMCAWFGVKGTMTIPSRIIMSLARDGALPFPQQLQMIKFGHPIVGLLIGVFVPAIFGAVQLGSSNAFASILGTAVIFLQVAYVTPVVCMLTGGRAKLNHSHPKRAFHLGRFGLPINVFSCFFVLQSCVVYCFPYTYPATSSNMNYVIAFVGGFLFLMALLWFGWARKRFKGPNEAEIIAFANLTLSHLVREGDETAAIL